MIRDPDALRVVWLFGRPYWWDRPDGQLTLQPANWITRPPREQPRVMPKPIADLLDGNIRTGLTPVRP